MLYAVILLRKTLGIMAFTSLVAAASAPQKTEKPDMQKVYDQAKNWSKAKLEEMPDPANAHQTANIGVCRGASAGEPLMIKPPCSKKQSQKIGDVIDTVTGDHPYEAKDSDQPLEASSNPHADMLSDPKELKILVFVSFSMPKASLMALSKAASKHNAVLVLKGLKGDSFKITQQAFLELANDSGNPNLELKAIAKNAPDDMQGFEVNPELFKTYQIKNVPTFVLVKNQTEIARLSGNVSLSFAAKKLREDN